MGEKYVIQEVSTDWEWLCLTGQLAQDGRGGVSGVGPPLPDREIPAKGRSLQQQCPTPVRPRQVLLVDVFTEWSGPCLAVENYLRRMRYSFVEDPNCLILARACCDHIEQLKAFRNSIIPTFLFWAGGRAVALLRGANRPLLTRMINWEVRAEMNNEQRRPGDPNGGPTKPLVDFESDKVIQCRGDLGELDEDDVIRSIGLGSTDRLSSVFNLSGTPSREVGPNDKLSQNMTPAQDDADGPVNDNVDEDLVEDMAHPVDDQVEPAADDAAELVDLGQDGTEASDTNQLQVTCINVDAGSLLSEDANEKGPEVSAGGTPAPVTDSTESLDEQEQGGFPDEVGKEVEKVVVIGSKGEEVSLSPFGLKKVKKRKKLETGLLKEILDFKPHGSRRHFH